MTTRRRRSTSVQERKEVGRRVGSETTRWRKGREDKEGAPLRQRLSATRDKLPTARHEPTRGRGRLRLDSYRVTALLVASSVWVYISTAIAVARGVRGREPAPYFCNSFRGSATRGEFCNTASPPLTDGGLSMRSTSTTTRPMIPKTTTVPVPVPHRLRRSTIGGTVPRRGPQGDDPDKG